MRYEVEERNNERPGRSEWRVIERETSDSIFALDDGTGQVVVDPRLAGTAPGLRVALPRQGDEQRPHRIPRRDGEKPDRRRSDGMDGDQDGRYQR